jgi:hypothetical protein
MVQVKLTSINFSHFFYQRLFQEYHIQTVHIKRNRRDDEEENRILLFVEQPTCNWKVVGSDPLQSFLFS